MLLCVCLIAWKSILESSHIGTESWSFKTIPGKIVEIVSGIPAWAMSRFLEQLQKFG